MKKNLLLIAVLLTSMYSSAQQTCGVLTDFKVNVNDIPATPISNVRLKFHVLQKSASDPQNFEDTPAMRAEFQAMVTSVNAFYSTFDPPTLPVIPANEEVYDSRVRFVLDDNDILFNVDYNGWNRRFDEDNYFNMGSASAINQTTFEQTITFLGQVSTGANGRIRDIFITKANNVVDQFDYIDGSVSYNGSTGITTLKIDNPSQINLQNSSLINVLIEKDKNQNGDNFSLYGANDPAYLHVFWTGGTSANTTGGGVGITNANWINIEFSSAYNGHLNWSTYQLLAHEIGHVLTLNHTHENGGSPQFSDLPAVDLGANFGDDCNTDPNVSNNIMGYNICRRYMSPLQVASMRMYLNKNANGRRIVEGCHKFAGQETYITTNTTWNHSQSIPSNIIISNNARLTINCSIFMNADTKIIVRPGADLVVDGGGIYSNCATQRWGGIVVEGDSYKKQNVTNQGLVHLKNGATLDKAYIGIQTIGENNDWHKTGGILRINEATISNCWKGISFLSYHNTYTGSTNEVSNVSFITNSEFVTDIPKNNTDFSHPDAFITLFDVNGIRIINNDFRQERFTNPYGTAVSKRGNGIRSLDASYKVNAYMDIMGNKIPGTENEFSNLNNAITVLGSSNRSDVKIVDNVLYGNEQGVTLMASAFSEVLTNNIKLKPRGYKAFTFGVYTAGAYGFNVEENTIESLTQYKKTQGVHANNSSSITSGSIYRNQLIKNKYNVQTTFQNTNLTVDCNEFTKHNVNRPDFNHYSGMLMNQGTAATPNNNKFYGAACNNTTKAQVYTNSSYSFIYTAKTGTVNPSCHNLGGNMIYSLLANNCPSNIVNVTTPISTGVIVRKDAVNVIKGNIAGIEEQLEEGVDPAEEELLLIELANLNGERLRISDEIVRIYLDTNYVSDAIAWLETEGSIESTCALVPLEITRNTNKVAQNIVTIRAFADALDLEGTDADRVKFLRDFCDYHEMVMPIVNRVDSYFGMSAAEQTAMENVANSHSLMATNAQSVLRFLGNENPTTTGYEANFGKSAIANFDEEESTDQVLTGIALFPNPSNGNATLQINAETVDFGINTYVLKLVNLQGKTVKNIAISNQTTNLELLDIPSGIYMVHLYENGSTIHSQKLVVTD